MRAIPVTEGKRIADTGYARRGVRCRGYLCVGASRTSDLGEISAAIRGGSLGAHVRGAPAKNVSSVSESETRRVTRVGIDGGQ